MLSPVALGSDALLERVAASEKAIVAEAVLVQLQLAPG